MDTAAQENRTPTGFEAMIAPLKTPIFRRTWSASILTNIGMMIGGVGAAWAMTQITTDPSVVSLVQTAQMAPSMLIALFAGAIADMFDRRKVGLFSLSISLTGATCLAILSALHLLTPPLLLALIFVIGSGMALFSPAWQASVTRQVPLPMLPAAVSLNGISYNLARSFGPAVGGLIVAVLGATAAFAGNGLAYIPQMVVLYLWRPPVETSRLPPETLGRAVVSGVRYAANSPPIRNLLLRSFVGATMGASAMGLMPLVAREILHGGAGLYGLMLGSFGIGAVIGGLNLATLRDLMGSRRMIQVGSICFGAALVIAGLSRSPYLTAPALMLAGACWTNVFTSLNVGVQVASPRWVSARAVSMFQTAMAGGLAIGGLVWGQVATHTSVGAALMISGALMAASVLLGYWLPVPDTEDMEVTPGEALADPEVSMALTGRSGPIVVHIEYRVAMDDARDFYRAMQRVEGSRTRNGAYGWSISRDIADPTIWIERYHTPTWHDFLRMRDRATAAERELQAEARAFHRGDQPVRISRFLERPYGSVRWREDVFDHGLRGSATGPDT